MYDIQDPYRMHPYDAPSDIKLFINSPSTYKRIKIDKNITPEDMRTTKAMTRGNEYDDYFCLPRDKFLDHYYVFAGRKPGDKVEAIVELIFEECLSDFCNPLSLNYLGLPLDKMDLTHKGLNARLTELITAYDYQGNWGMDARLKGIDKNGGTYFSQLAECGNKTMLDMETYNNLSAVINELEADSIWGPTLKALRNPALRPPHIEVIFQSEGYCDRLAIKGKRDIIIINHQAKTKQVIDIKTAESYHRFIYNYFTYRYDIQGDMYTAIEKLDPKNEGYKILPARFLVIYTGADTTERFHMFSMTLNDHLIAHNGGILGPIGKVEGWNPILQEINWHKQHNNFKHRKVYFDNNNVFKMEDILATQIVYKYDNKK